MQICMIGAGYVGLVSAACFSEFGWEVTCVDKDEGRLAELGRGVSPIYEPGLETLMARNMRPGASASHPRSGRPSPRPTSCSSPSARPCAAATVTPT